MEWLKSAVGGEKEVAPEIPDVTPPAPSDFQMTDVEVINYRLVKPGKYDEIGSEAKDLILEQHEFQEGLTVAMQKPIVEPVGTPGPPQGPGPHKNYQAQLFEKIQLSTPNSSNFAVGIQASFKPDRTDAIMCTYNSQSGHSGILARGYGPVEMVAQWMQTPYGGLALYANADYKASSSVTSLTYIKGQMWILSHLHSLWTGFQVGVKTKYDIMGSRTKMEGGVKWGSPNKDMVWSAEADESGGFKMSCFKKLEGVSDTTVCTVYDFNAAQGPQQPASSQLWVGFGKEYLNQLKVRLAMSSLLQIKGNIEGVVGRAMKASYSFIYDPHKKSYKHGVQLEL
eukprot:TRINITY_DN8943_c0_g1_i1.p1 TRINITY_DN8943_c0_g1~~TRINITY_DN8943_c0_g1_i1.p1  ORF type:complete len:356 (+),score=109.09 TRINITY_DN8943_c0_g1_i1:52-1068(+)